jgi:hypothetical protein
MQREVERFEDGALRGVVGAKENGAYPGVQDAVFDASESVDGQASNVHWFSYGG